MVRTRPKGERDPGWVRISWEETLSLAASRLMYTKGWYGAETVVFSRATPTGSATSDLDGWFHRLADAFGSQSTLPPERVARLSTIAHAVITGVARASSAASAMGTNYRRTGPRSPSTTRRPSRQQVSHAHWLATIQGADTGCQGKVMPP